MSIIGRIDRDIKVGVITISDTRTKDNDKGGRKVIQHLETLNAVIGEGDYMIVKDDALEITKAIEHMVESGLDAVITTGGTGIAHRDVTIEALRPLFDKEIEGFGEIFRMLSFTEDIGSRSILSRAVAGTMGRTVIFALPGSTGAVTLGMERLIVPELNHFVHELNK
ncbi:MogA/MoaB family molybdenum cofactor biosynthesis protein [Salinicoccus roseus]|uniref:Molybdenum cofactor biosynthesis protein B n=1 Tax=Salinicoccus roseus TaxID=45670 RepID=A0A0C2HDE6_9STAP|nr:MogA/MoaB family molybdenum cofactor biosynthesis protein [Salinicoccus roseus]KIH71690.1 molybdenum cofactor biosynthesis protein B [Salinicoccus roseus]MDB0579791.1 MogA/MoaB family molybdenum cofactor biosynthesis protein [Salinicoccus roseus]